MNTWYYYDSEGNRQGPINDDQFKEMASQVPGIFPSQGHPLGNSPFGSIPQQTVPAGESHCFCTNCGKPVGPNAIACMACGAAPVGHRKFCRGCGVSLNPEQIICIKCGAGINVPQNAGPNGYNYNTGYQNQPGMYPGNPGMNGGYAPQYHPPKNRTVAGWLGIFLGHLGVHKFYMGSWGWGLVYIVAIFATAGFGWFVTSIVGLCEGISYLMLSDQEFAAKYPNETINPFRW